MQKFPARSFGFAALPQNTAFPNVVELTMGLHETAAKLTNSTGSTHFLSVSVFLRTDVNYCSSITIHHITVHHRRYFVRHSFLMFSTILVYH